MYFQTFDDKFQFIGLIAVLPVQVLLPMSFSFYFQILISAAGYVMLMQGLGINLQHYCQNLLTGNFVEFSG